MISALYQKYRPNKFKDVFGENHIVKSLTQAINLNQISHSYIFFGPRGIGKTTIAKIFAKAVNCLQKKDGDACNQCENCLKINNQQSMDIIEIDAASNNGVAEIRQLIDTVNYLPTDLKIKIYILDEAHMLTQGAWNALLKTIEECPKHVIFIFATTEYHKIPLTIISRCQCFGFKPLSEDILYQLILKVSKNEKIQIDGLAIKKICNLANGSARDVLTFLDQIRSYSNNETIKSEDIDTIFGLLDNEKKIKFINCLANENLENSIKLIEEFETEGINLNLLIQNTFGIFIDIYLYSKKIDLKLLKLINEDDIKKIKMTGNQALKFAREWENLCMKLKYNSNIKYNLELAIFNVLNSLNINTENNFLNNKEDKNIDLINTQKLNNLSKNISNEKKLINSSDIKLDQIFDIKEIKLDDDKFISDISINTTMDTYNINNDVKFLNILNKNDFLKSTFLSIANFEDRNLYKHYQEIFKNLKKNDENIGNPLINVIIDAKKILIASKKGIVFLFNDKDQVIFLKNKTFDVNFNKFIYKIFGTPLLVIGLTKSMAKEYTKEYLKIKQQKISINDLNINDIELMVLPKRSTQEFAMNFFGDELKIE